MVVEEVPSKRGKKLGDKDIQYVSNIGDQPLKLDFRESNLIYDGEKEEKGDDVSSHSICPSKK